MQVACLTLHSLQHQKKILRQASPPCSSLGWSQRRSGCVIREKDHAFDVNRAKVVVA